MICIQHYNELNEEIIHECDKSVVKQYTCNESPCVMDHMLVVEDKWIK